MMARWLRRMIKSISRGGRGSFSAIVDLHQAAQIALQLRLTGLQAIDFLLKEGDPRSRRPRIIGAGALIIGSVGAVLGAVLDVRIMFAEGLVHRRRSLKILLHNEINLVDHRLEIFAAPVLTEAPEVSDLV